MLHSYNLKLIIICVLTTGQLSSLMAFIFRKLSPDTQWNCPLKISLRESFFVILGTGETRTYTVHREKSGQNILCPYFPKNVFDDPNKKVDAINFLKSRANDKDAGL